MGRSFFGLIRFAFSPISLRVFFISSILSVGIEREYCNWVTIPFKDLNLSPISISNSLRYLCFHLIIHLFILVGHAYNFLLRPSRAGRVKKTIIATITPPITVTINPTLIASQNFMITSLRVGHYNKSLPLCREYFCLYTGVLSSEVCSKIDFRLFFFSKRLSQCYVLYRSIKNDNHGLCDFLSFVA